MVFGPEQRPCFPKIRPAVKEIAEIVADAEVKTLVGWVVGDEFPCSYYGETIIEP